MRVSRLSTSRISSRAATASATRSSRFADSAMRWQFAAVPAKVRQPVAFRWLKAVHGLRQHQRKRVLARSLRPGKDQRLRKMAAAQTFSQVPHSCRIAMKILETHPSSLRHRSDPLSQSLGTTVTWIPFFGRSVIFGCNSIFCPATGSHTPALGNRRQRQNGFHPGKRFPDTLPPASAKRKIGKPWPARLGLRGKSLRTEPLRLRKPPRIPLHNVLAEEDHRSLPKPVRPDRHILAAPPAPSPRPADTSRIDSDSTMAVYSSRGMSSSVGSRPPRTASSSA